MMVTKAEFQRYEAVRRRGLVNMLSPQVCQLAKISKETHGVIIRTYEQLAKKWPDVVEEYK